MFNESHGKYILYYPQKLPVVQSLYTLSSFLSHYSSFSHVSLHKTWLSKRLKILSITTHCKFLLGFA